MISFIVPAHNEQACLPRTLSAIHSSAKSVGEPYEIIVVDDASTDATAEIARQHDARVVAVNHRQIAATRNAGARVARGERLFFVDADTTINPRTVAAALRQMGRGAVGGGAPVWFDQNEVVPLYIRLFGPLARLLPKLLGFSGGAFMFCTREAFHATGGFNERLFWGEEGAFALALKREGRFAGLWEPVFTSGRRLRTTAGSGLQMLRFFLRAIFSPVKTFTRRSSVEKIWYDSNRANDEKMPGTPGVRISNAIIFLVLAVMVTGPLWNFVPRSLTPLDSVPGKIRLIIATFLSHVGVILFWPSGVILFLNLWRHKRWAGWLHSAAVTALCLWLAWDCTRGVIRVWTMFYRWLAGV